MENINITEQWLLEGKCKHCRRSDYCSKPCKAHKQHVGGMISGLIRDYLPLYPGIYEKY